MKNGKGYDIQVSRRLAAVKILRQQAQIGMGEMENIVNKENVESVLNMDESEQYQMYKQMFGGY